jgi:hypothetical protein
LTVPWPCTAEALGCSVLGFTRRAFALVVLLALASCGESAGPDSGSPSPCYQVCDACGDGTPTCHDTCDEIGGNAATAGCTAEFEALERCMLDVGFDCDEALPSRRAEAACLDELNAYARCS